MKKLFLLTLAVIFAFSMNAQKFGLRLGGNFADMTTTVKSKGTKIAPGMQIGLLTELGPDMVALRIEANFAQKGFNFEDSYENLDGILVESKGKVNFGYVEIPALLKVKVFGPMYVYGGPYFGFALSGKQTTDELTNDGLALDVSDLEKVNIFKIDENNPIPYKRADFGAAMGLGAQFGIGPINLFAEGRASLGLSNLYDTEADAWDDLVTNEGWKETEKLKNMVWTVAIGILLGD